MFYQTPTARATLATVVSPDREEATGAARQKRNNQYVWSIVWEDSLPTSREEDNGNGYLLFFGSQ